MKHLLFLIILTVPYLCTAQRIQHKPYVRPDDSSVVGSVVHYPGGPFTINVLLKRQYGTDQHTVTIPQVQLNNACDTLEVSPYYSIVKVIKIGHNYYRIADDEEGGLVLVARDKYKY